MVAESIRLSHIVEVKHLNLAESEENVELFWDLLFYNDAKNTILDGFRFTSARVQW